MLLLSELIFFLLLNYLKFDIIINFGLNVALIISNVLNDYFCPGPK